MSKKSLNIIIVDDEINIRRTLSYCLVADNHNVVSVSTSIDAIYEVRQTAFDIAFIDIRLGQESGIDLIEPLLFESPWTKIVIITAHASIENAVKAMQKGATDYIEKPFTPAQIRLLTNKIGKIRELENQIAVLNQNVPNIDNPFLLSSKNAQFQRVIEMAKKAATSEAILLIQGESGTGKSLLARAIHGWSARALKPMAVVSCPSIPSELLESELFGHVKGSFTGAFKDNHGRIASCEGGTIFLDEIGDMPLSLQPKILRFIQDKTYERLGDPTQRKADVRIITATNVDLNKRVAEGLFREDLFYRINVITITLPPLREHPEDIMAMALDFMAFFCRLNHKTFLGFEPQAEKMLINHNWSGNIRELRNAVERAVILGNGKYIGVKDLPENINPQDRRLNPSIGDPISLSQIEEMHIRRLLAHTSSIHEAADILGIDQATLWRKRKIYTI
ncbi:MAG: sigma-54-dependent Fis family transcriptional regulator [Desulfamplus sp.]|nr:sigma-54-dependent Fis family transcriptional regulator [Desulfamplus sp.]